MPHVYVGVSLNLLPQSCGGVGAERMFGSGLLPLSSFYLVLIERFYVIARFR